MLPDTPPTTLFALNLEVKRAKSIVPAEQHQWLDKYYGFAWGDTMLRDIDEGYAVRNAWESIANLIKAHAAK